MVPAALPPKYPRAAPRAARADLSAAGSKRYVQRRHCLYTVSQDPKRAVVWCRPVSQAAAAWMRAQGFDCRRLTCAWEEVEPLIDSQEQLVEAARLAGPPPPVPAMFHVKPGAANAPSRAARNMILAWHPPRKPFSPAPRPPSPRAKR